MKKAFTLIEVVVVLCILVILAALLIPAIQAAKNRRQPTIQQLSPQTPSPLTVTPLGGGWNQIEFNYQGTKHVYLQNYDRDNQAIAKVGEFRISTD